MIVFFDTETTGIPVKGSNWETDYNSFPYIVQLSWKRSDQDEVKDFIVKPEGYEIPEFASQIHGITTERALAEGDYFENVIRHFISDCLDAEKIVGHNIYFDTSNLKANVCRYVEKNGDSGPFDVEWIDKIVDALDKSKRIDTMMKTVKFCNIPFPNGKGQKWPTLIELYDKLFNEEFPAHNSKFDVLATERSYYELVKLGIL